jgi:hypothetical protein
MQQRPPLCACEVRQWVKTTGCGKVFMRSQQHFSGNALPYAVQRLALEL